MRDINETGLALAVLLGHKGASFGTAILQARPHHRTPDRCPENVWSQSARADADLETHLVAILSAEFSVFQYLRITRFFNVHLL